MGSKCACMRVPDENMPSRNIDSRNAIDKDKDLSHRRRYSLGESPLRMSQVFITTESVKELGNFGLDDAASYRLSDVDESEYKLDRICDSAMDHLIIGFIGHSFIENIENDIPLIIAQYLLFIDEKG